MDATKPIVEPPLAKLHSSETGGRRTTDRASAADVAASETKQRKTRAIDATKPIAPPPASPPIAGSNDGGGEGHCLRETQVQHALSASVPEMPASAGGGEGHYSAETQARRALSAPVSEIPASAGTAERAIPRAKPNIRHALSAPAFRDTGFCRYGGEGQQPRETHRPRALCASLTP